MKKIIATFVVTGLLLSNPIVSDAALGDRTLKSGITHSEVKELQQVLKNKGYFTNKNTTTYFGTATKSAVVKFQKNKGLKADGIVGASTYKALGIKKQTAKATQVGGSSTTSSAPQTKAIAAAKTKLGVPYKWGGMSSSGYDCSGLIKYSFAKAGKTLPRTTVEMYKKGTRVTSLKPGDLMFFAPNKASRVTHASIYIGNGKMIHSASSKGVSIASTSNSYWKPQFVGAKRL